MQDTFALEMKKINKEFPGVKALDDVSLQVKHGEVRALVGENGAGKSTLMKVLNGVYNADSGSIYMDGQEVSIKSPLDAQKKGLAIIFQEFNLFSSLTVAENIYAGRLTEKVSAGKNDKEKSKFVNWKEINNRAANLLHSLGYNLSPTAYIKDLTVAEKQMVEITKAISFNSRIIVMDEPSAVLTENELVKLFDIIRDLKNKGITIIYISHRLEEIFEICDSVTVMRDGKMITTKEIQSVSKNQLMELMIGRPLNQEYPTRNTTPQNEVVLEATDINCGKKVQGVSFKLKKGEVLGFAGLVGAGRTETMRAIFGADKKSSGSIKLHGKEVFIKSPKDAVRYGIALLPEDRKNQGLLLDMPINQNITLVKLSKIMKPKGVLNRGIERSVSKNYLKELAIKAPSVTQKVNFLSGGNQQKVVIAKWLFSESDIFILDEPTRGIDVGAKYEIYRLINDLVAKGKSIIIISSEMNEVVALSDRVYVMRDGKIVTELKGDEIKANNIIKNEVD